MKSTKTLEGKRALSRASDSHDLDSEGRRQNHGDGDDFDGLC